MKISEALSMSLMGILTVFVVLVVLMGVIYIMSAVFKKRDTGEVVAVAAVASGAAAPALSSAPPAKGSCGEMSMFNVPDKTAALVMAVIADELDTPLNELRFISIREVEEETR